jgi:hypothetical protein
VLGNETLSLMYKLNFQMMQHHKYSLSEVEEMLPFEREIYLALLAKHVREENERIKNAKQKRRK